MTATQLVRDGQKHYQTGQYDQALNNFQQALIIVREVGDRTGEGATLNNIGAVYRAQGKYQQALNNYEQALVIAREVGAKPLEYIILEAVESLPKSEGPAQT